MDKILVVIIITNNSLSKIIIKLLKTKNVTIIIAINIGSYLLIQLLWIILWNMILGKEKIWREWKKKSYILIGKKSRKEKENGGNEFSWEPPIFLSFQIKWRHIFPFFFFFKYILAPHIFAEHSVKEFRFFFFWKSWRCLKNINLRNIFKIF